MKIFLIVKDSEKYSGRIEQDSYAEGQDYENTPFSYSGSIDYIEGPFQYGEHEFNTFVSFKGWNKWNLIFKYGNVVETLTFRGNLIVDIVYICYNDRNALRKNYIDVIGHYFVHIGSDE